MDPRLERHIASARDEVLDAKDANISKDRKDGLVTMLDRAYACANGNADKIPLIAEAVACLIIHTVTTETRAADHLAKAIDAHAGDCKANKLPKTMREFMLSLASQYPLLAVIFIGVALERGWFQKIWALL
jgi:hypothetical protein